MTELSNLKVEQSFRTLANYSPIMMRMYSEKDQLYFCSKRWLDFRGKTLDEELKGTWQEDIHPEDQEQALTLIQHRRQERLNYECTYRILNAEGRYRWVLDTAEPRIDDRGQYLGYIVTTQDITDKRLNQEKLTAERVHQESLAKIQNSLRKANFLAITTSVDGKILFCNEALCLATGYREEEMMGKNAFDLFIPRDKKSMYISAYSQLLEEGEYPKDMQDRIWDKNNKWIYIRYVTIILNNPYDPQSGITLVAEDVTEKNRVAKALKRSNSRLQELFDNAHDLIQVFTIDGEFKFVNESWKNKIGYSDEELVNLRFFDIVHPDYRIHTENFLKHLAMAEGSSKLETVIVSKDQQNIFLSGNVNCSFENGSPIEFRTIFHDITDRLRTEKIRNLYYSIANQTNLSTNFAELYKNIHSELNNFLDAKNFYFAIFENDELVFPFFVLNNEIQHYSGEGPERMITEYALRENRSFMVKLKDFESLIKQGILPAMEDLPSVWLGAPLKLEQRTIGLIAIMSYKQTSPFDRTDLEMLDFMSGQIALAIDRKRTEEKVNNQTARLNAIFESSSHLIWSINRNYEFTSFNQNYSNIIFKYLGARPKPNEQFNISTNLPTRQSNNHFWVQKYQQVFAGNSLHFETRFKGEFGNEIWLDIFLNPIYQADGSVKEVSGIAHDITDKKRSGLALRESEEKFRNIFESFQDLYFKCDLQGSILMVSPSILEMTGYEQFEVLEKNITNYYLYTPKTKDLIRQLVKNKSVRNFEASLVRRDGNIMQCICNVRLKIGNEGALEIEGVVRDITQLKETNDQLVHAKELAERSLKIKDQFLANMSHEIRTPMNGIVGMVDLLSTTSLKGEQSEYLETIKKSSEVLLEILNDILDLSKIEAGKMTLRTSPVELRQVIGKLYAMFSQQATAHKINLAYYINPRLPEYVIIDETRLMQIISNLLSNAIKFTKDGGSVHLSMKPQFKYDKTHVIKVEVRDTGIGIAKENLSSLFKSFSQIDDSSTKSFGGTGLGLRISKELCQLMNGNIGVYSTPNLGSTFWFTFEATETTKKAVEQQIQEKDEITVNVFSESKPKVLLVDDNQINRQVAGEILKASGCLVDLATNGHEAIALVEKKNYDIIFMDIQMPEMDGVTATKKLKSMNLSQLPPIVAMTAYSMGPDRERFLSQGMDDYLAKPIKGANLINKVKRWVNGSGEKIDTAITIEDSTHIVKQEIIDQLSKYSGPEMVKDILVDFENETAEQIHSCEESLKSQDYQNILTNLHTLKGNAGTLGVEKVAGLAKKIEADLKQEDYTQVKQDLSELRSFFIEFQDNYLEILNL